MVAAAADRAGGAGVELWLHRRLRIEGGSVICPHAEPRRMLVRLALGTTPITVFVAKAPSCEPTHAAEEATTQWWLESGRLANRLRPQGADIVTLIDASARVGSVTSQCVGGCEPEEQNHAGACFHDFLQRIGQLAPSTFMGGGPTWRANSGAWHRIDYALLPLEWMAGLRGMYAHGPARHPGDAGPRRPPLRRGGECAPGLQARSRRQGDTSAQLRQHESIAHAGRAPAAVVQLGCHAAAPVALES